MSVYLLFLVGVVFKVENLAVGKIVNLWRLEYSHKVRPL